MSGRQQQVVMTAAQPQHQHLATHHYTTTAHGGQHFTTQVMTNSPCVSSGVMAPPPVTAINVVQMVGPGMAGGLTAAPLQVQSPTILVGSSATPGVLLPPDATFLSTDPNTGLTTGLTYPVQIVGVAASSTQHMLAVRPPHTSAGKVVNCLTSPTVGSDATGLHIYSPNPSPTTINTRHLCPGTALLTPDYLTYQQHVFMQQQQQHPHQTQHHLQNKACNTLLAQHTALIAANSGAITSPSSTTVSSSLLDSSHSVSISTQTLQCESTGDNCDVSSTGDIQQQQSRACSTLSLSPNSPSHQSAEVTTTRLDEEPTAVGTPHKASSSSSSGTPPLTNAGWSRKHLVLQ